MRELFRRLAGLGPDRLPVLSVYLDMRPQATGERPAVRSGLVVLKDRLREIEKTLRPRGPAFDSFRTDRERVLAFLDEQYRTAAQGVALFACAGRAVFEAAEAGVPFDNEVSVGAVANLFQLARLLDGQETSVVAAVDTTTARLFVWRIGLLEEVGGPGDEPHHYGKRAVGGWSQARYQRHVQEHRDDFAREAAAEIGRLVEREGAARLILAGDEVAIPLLLEALPDRVARLADGDVLRIDIRAGHDDLKAEVEPVLAAAEAEAARSAADQLIGAIHGSGLGLTGVDEVRAALAHGQVDLLLLDPGAAIDEGTRRDLVRLAARTGAGVEVVERHDALGRLGGVGALLRYRHEPEPGLAASRPAPVPRRRRGGG